MRSFTIATDAIGPRRWWIVRIHENVHQLREAAHRHRPWHGRAHWDECWGCCQPLGWPNEGYDWPSSGYAGIVRLTSDYLDVGVIAHELVHAAAWTYRMNVKPRIFLGDQVGDREEQLAYIYGELFADLYRKV